MTKKSKSATTILKYFLNTIIVILVFSIIFSASIINSIFEPDNTDSEQTISSTTNTGFNYTIYKDNNGLTFAVITGYNGNDTELTIPGYIEDLPTIIDTKAFYNSTSIQKLTISNGCVRIRDEAFSLCSELESINLPESMESIGNNAFYECIKLSDISLKNGIKEIGEYAFSKTDYAFNESNWDNDLLYIGPYLISAHLTCEEIYHANSPITSCKIKEGTTLIADSALAGFLFTPHLTDVKLPTSLEYIGRSAFDSCNNLTNINFPTNLKEIGANAFSNCEKLKEIPLPPNIEYIGGTCFDMFHMDEMQCAFYNTGYYNNKDNWYDDVLYIDNYLIKAKTSVESHNVKPGTTLIASYAFGECSSLSDITLPSSLTNIGYNAFYGCSLEKITIKSNDLVIASNTFPTYNDNVKYINIEGDVKYIGDNAFGPYSKLYHARIKSKNDLNNIDCCEQLLAAYNAYRIKKPLYIISISLLVICVICTTILSYKNKRKEKELNSINSNETTNHPIQE